LRKLHKTSRDTRPKKQTSAKRKGGARGEQKKRALDKAGDGGKTGKKNSMGVAGRGKESKLKGTRENRDWKRGSRYRAERHPNYFRERRKQTLGSKKRAACLPKNMTPAQLPPKTIHPEKKLDLYIN